MRSWGSFGDNVEPGMLAVARALAWWPLAVVLLPDTIPDLGPVGASSALVGIPLYVLGVWMLGRLAARRSGAPERRVTLQRVDALVVALVGGTVAVGTFAPNAVPATLTLVLGCGLTVRFWPRGAVLGTARVRVGLLVIGAAALVPWAMYMWTDAVRLARFFAIDANHAGDPSWSLIVLGTASAVGSLWAALFLASRAVRAGKLPTADIPEHDGAELTLRVHGGGEVRVVAWEGARGRAGQTVTVVGATARGTSDSPYRQNVPVIQVSELWAGTPGAARRKLALRALGWTIWAGATATTTLSSWVELVWAFS